jgi:bifunctional isochorismate lyase/aryl carrier protein
MLVNSIASYRMPNDDDLPSAEVPWRPSPSRAVVLVHDMQQYFLRPFAAAQHPRTELVSNTAAVIAAARGAGVPVVYTAQPGGMSREDRGLLHDFWGPGMSPDDTDRGIIDDIAPLPGEKILTKWRYSAFYRSDLETWMRAACRSQLIVCGVYAHIGCLATVCDAFHRDIEPFLVADAIADFSLDHHLMALRYAAGRCAVPLTTAETAQALARQPATSITSSAGE